MTADLARDLCADIAPEPVWVRQLRASVGAIQEPAWAPSWLPNDDGTLRWISKGVGPDGTWQLEAEPEHSPAIGPTLEVFHYSLISRLVTFTPDQMRALIAIGAEWLRAIDETGGAS